MNPSPVPTFSLIVPTLNRLEQVRRLFDSIQQSITQDFEVLVIDQNEGPLIDALCVEYAAHFPLRQVKIAKKGVSHARNFGFTLAQGAVINFPDDDCELTPTLLGDVANLFAKSPSLDMLFGRAVDAETGTTSVTRFADQAQPVTETNVFTTTVEFTMFLKRQVWLDVGQLDERLGVGCYFGAEEGSDFVLRALYLKKHIYYDPALLFYHEQKVGQFTAQERARAFSYGRGFGRMSMKHWLKYRRSGALLRFLHFQLRTACGMILFAARFNLPRCRYYLNVWLGRFVGAWRSSPEFIGASLPDKKTKEEIGP